MSTAPDMAAPASSGGALPEGLEITQLARRALQVILVLGAVVLVVLLAPGLGDVRDLLVRADPAWIAFAVVLELLSCGSYVLFFRPVFCRRMSWMTSSRIGWSELGMGAIVPAGGTAGLALGAWALTKGGMSADRVARRSVAFFLIKSSVNFVAVLVLGVLMAVGLLGPPVSLWLTALPAAMAAATIAAVLAVPRLGPGSPAPEGSGRVRRGSAALRGWVIDGTREALEILRSRDPLVLIGAVGYWLWDNLVLWAAFHAFGVPVDLSIIFMGYLIGQLGGALPIPGGIGGVDGGLIGALVLFGAPVAATAAAVLAYRVVLFWVSFAGGAAMFVSLQRHLRREDDEIFSPC